MRASYRWLCELTGLNCSPAEMARKLTDAGLEIEGETPFAHGFTEIVVADVRAKKAHPSKSKLTLVQVFDGTTEFSVVCGANNVPEPGAQRVVLAKVGATLPNGLAIAPREVAGIPSFGMLCAEDELGVGSDHDGILLLPTTYAVGTPFADVVQDDTIFDINVTPNRPDALGHQGLARELRVLFNLTPTASTTPTLPNVPAFPITIAAQDRCSHYLGVALDDVHIGPSPLWLRARLFSLGQRSINAAVDITNWIAIEWGHPIHVFDRDRLAGDGLEVRNARAGEKLETLDGQTRELHADDLVVADLERPVALAGVMGGQDSGVRLDTRRIVLEVAVFQPQAVRRTAKRHGIHSEASHRFERGVDPTDAIAVAARTLALLQELVGGNVVALGDVRGQVRHATEIAFEPEKFASWIGYELPQRRMADILTGLGCVVREQGAHWQVEVPGHRPDLQRGIDLVEEIARVEGYDKIPERLATLPRALTPMRPELRLVRTLRDTLTSLGLYDCVNFSFLSHEVLDRVDSRTRAERIDLKNPLTQERSVMRTSLLPGLLEAVARGERHQVARFTLFEIGRVYTAAPQTSPPIRERRLLALTLSGTRDSALYTKESVFDFYDLKGILESVFGDLHLPIEVRQASPDATPYLHPRRAAEVFVLGKSIGYMGEVHPDVRDRFALRTVPFIAELEIESWLDMWSARVPNTIRALAKAPTVRRDVALLVAESVQFADVANEVCVRGSGNGVEARADVFDVYAGIGIEKGKKSLGVGVTYAPEATLTDSQIDALHSKVVAGLVEKFAASVR